MVSCTPSRFDRLVQICLITAFLGALALPFTGMLLRLDETDLREKRTLAPRPAFGEMLRHATPFVRQLRAYLEDHFGFRSRLVAWNARLNARLVKVSPSPQVVMGRDGWLFYTGDCILEDYRQPTPLSEAELQQWTALLERRQQWLNQRGIRFLFFVAPNPHTIYPEKLPASFQRVRNKSRLDQLMDYLGTHSSVSTLDLRPALMAAKSKERIYQKTDSHWNERGAFVVYQEITNRFAEWFPSIKVVPRSRFVETVAWRPGGDLVGIMGMTDSYQEEMLGLRPLDPRAASIRLWPLDKSSVLKSNPKIVQESNIPGSRMPRLVMFHDSFGMSMLPFLSEHFSRALYAFKPMSFDTALLEKEKPDLVIQEFTERYLLGDYGFFSHPEPEVP